jgi:2-polyprenyl-6-methoxyphenol hydroxylase-like FAD-dependent oxidoreductase
MIRPDGRSPIARRHYDVVIAGARCAGAATAMLLARQGFRVLVVDPMRRGSDTLSTHAMMRGGVLQLRRWGLLDAIRAAGTPTIRATTFHYADEAVEVRIKERDGIDGLYAPRRTVLDPVLLDAAETAGAEVALGYSLVGLLRDGGGRVRGATVAGPDRREIAVTAETVIGADGVHSRVARLVEAPVDYAAARATASIFSYRRNLGLEGFHWFYQLGAAVGAIPTNDDDTCVFASLPSPQFEARRRLGIEALYEEVLEQASPELADLVRRTSQSGKARAFPGIPGFLKRAAGPGWALVGDAGYFKDPLTAHGITDALRDAELLARALIKGGDAALEEYQSIRDELVMGLFDVTDRIASFDWSLEEVKVMHLTLSKEMNAEVDLVRTWDSGTDRPGWVGSAPAGEVLVGGRSGRS